MILWRFKIFFHEKEYDEFEATKPPFSSLNDGNDEGYLYTSNENSTIETNKYSGEQNNDIQKRRLAVLEDKSVTHDNTNIHYSDNQDYAENDEMSQSKNNFGTIKVIKTFSVDIL